MIVIALHLSEVKNNNYRYKNCEMKNSKLLTTLNSK